MSNEPWMTQHGAVIHVAGSRPEAALSAIDEALAALGWSLITEERAADTSDPKAAAFQVITWPRGALIFGTMPSAAAFAAASRLALGLKKTVKTCTMVAQFAENRRPSCTLQLDARSARPDGSLRPLHLPLEELADEDLHTDKPWRLVELVANEVFADWLPPEHTVEPLRVYAVPASSGDPKLDRLLARIRLASSARLAEVEGRPCVQLRSADGTRETAFLTAAEAARVQGLAGAALDTSP